MKSYRRMNEIEELYQLLQGKVKTGSLEEFTQRMQNPKSLAAVKKYAQERYNSIQLTKGGPTFSVKPDPLEKELNTAKAADRAEAEKQNKSASASGVNIPFKVNQGEQYRLPTKEEEATFFPPYKEKILTGLEAVPIAELQTKRKATEERLNVMGQQFDDQAFNELTTKATALQQELQSLLPEVEKGASKQKSTFATLQAGLKEKETELQQIASKLDAAKPLEEELKLLAAQHKAAKTPEQANALAAAYNTKLGEYTAATSGATKEYNEKLAKYTEEVKLANAKVAKLSPAALTRYNAIIRELKTIENDPAMAKRSQMADEYNALIAESKKLTTELKNRMPDGPLEQFTMTSPTYRAERQRIIFEKLTPEQKAKEMRSSLFLSETTYNPQGEVTAKLNGFESYEEMRLATTAGLAAADLKQKPVPLTKEQVEAMNSFIQENYADMPATSIAELEAHLTDMAGTSPNNFWRTVKQTTTGRPVAAIANSIISSPVTGVLGMFTKEEAGVKEVTKARILEEAYASKLGKVKSRMSDLEVAIDSDPALLEEYRTFAESSAVINELQDKKRTAEEDQKLDEAYTAIGNLQTTEMKEYAALMQQYKSDYKNLASVVNYFPEELARRTALSLKNNQTVINDNDTMIVKTAKQLDAIKGAATNTALRIGGNTLKTLTTLGDRIDRAVTGEEYTSATERYFEETGKFLESAIFLPELPEDMRSTIAQDLMGNSKIRGQAVLPGIATGIVQMGALVFGAKGMTAPLGGGLIGSSRALTASGFVFEFNDIYESFLDAGLSSRTALGLAAGISYGVARMEGISPQGVGISFFDQTVKKAISKLITTAAKDFGTGFSQGALHVLKEVGLENLQEFSQDSFKTISNYLINKGYGTDLDGSFDMPEIAETALITTGTTLVFSLLNGKSQIRGEAYSAAKYLAEKPEQLEEELQRRVSEGKLDMDMARDIFNFVTKVKETVDANKAKEAFDKKIEGYSPQKPMVEDYEGPTEIAVDEYFAADYKVPTGVIVNWDGKKYQVLRDDKGTTLTLMEEVEAPAPIEEQIEKDDEEYNRLVDIVNKQDRRVGDPITPEEQQLMDMASAREATTPELKPTKTKLTAAEFNELVQAPTGERIPTEIETAQVAEYQGKEYNVTKVEGDQVTLTNFAGTAQMTVPVSEVTPFTVEPLQTIQFEGKDHKVNTAQRDLIGAIDSHEQQQINAINNSTLTDGQKKTKIKTLQDSLNRSRREVLGIKEDMRVGGTAYYGGKPVKIKKLTKNTAKIELDGVETTVQRSALSLSDTTPLDEAAAQLKQRGHTFTLHAGKPMSKQDTDAYMKTDSRTAKIVGRVKQLLPVLAKSGIKIKVFSDVQSAEEAALELGADSRAVRGIRHDGKEVLTEEYLGNGISQVTYEDGTTANVPQVEIKYTTFNGFFDPKTNQIIINAQAAAASTVEHEFLHPIIESILANNPETVVRFFNELKQLPEWADLKDFVDQYDANEQPIEALIEFTARVISPEFKFKARPATFKRKVVDFFQRLFGIDPTIKINTNNVLDFATSLKESFEKGVAFKLGELSNEGRFGGDVRFSKQTLAPNGKPSNLTPEQLIQNGEITFVDEQGKPCAEMGMRSSFTKGKSWRVVKDLKGYPTHAEGGVDLQFDGGGVKIKKGETTITAKYGLVINGTNPDKNTIYYEENGEVKQVDRRSGEYRNLYNSGKLTTYDAVSDSYLAPPMKPVEVKSEAPYWLSSKKQAEAKYDTRKKSYLQNPFSAGRESFVKENVAKTILRQNPYKRGQNADEYMASLTDKEREYLTGSSIWDKHSKSYYDKIQQGLLSLVGSDDIKMGLKPKSYTTDEAIQETPLAAVEGVGGALAKPIQGAVGSFGNDSFKNPDGSTYTFGDALKGKQNDAPAVIDAATDLTNFTGLAAVSKAVKVAKAITRTEKMTEAMNIIKKFDDFKGDDDFFRIVVGDEAFDDIVTSGVIRTKKPAEVVNDGGKITLDRRGTTSFPSFSKGTPSLDYAQSDPNHYIITTKSQSIKPSTSGRHGKGSTMFPTDEHGRHLKELNASEADVYKHIGDGKYELVFKGGGK